MGSNINETLISAADLWKNCGFGGKSTKIGTDHADYTRIDLGYSAKPDF